MSYITTLIILGCINMIAVSGMTLLTGYTGIFSIGHAGFFAIGAYTATILYLYCGVPFLLAIIIAGIVAALSSVIVGYPSLRSKLTGDYFAITMLGFGEAIRLLIANTKPIVNGAIGITGIPKLSTIWVVLPMAAVLIFLMRNFVKSQFGKNCIAVQQQEVAAEMIGINVVKVKLTSLMISAFYAGIAGGLYAFFIQFISPQAFTQAKSTDLLAAVIIGGINTMTGPLIAAFVLVILPEILRFLVMWRLVFYGLVFVVIMLFRPEGLLGYREISFKFVKKLFFYLKGKLKKHTKEERS